jgi:hypothetical protein
MARSGSENRQRQRPLKARFTDEEAALIEEQADRAGVSVAALIRHAVLNQPPLRASRQPSINQQEAARLLGKLGQLAAVLRSYQSVTNPGEHAVLLEAAHRDLADMRVALFQALGREP